LHYYLQPSAIVEIIMVAVAIPLPPAGAMSPGFSDQQLLASFVGQRDEAAFGELVRRHGRTVWGVCRRLLASQEDAEDAFQAVFAILARKAAMIRKGEAVGSWLYGVAFRTAQRARHQGAQRRQRETQARPAAPEQPAWCDAACRELQRLLDEEVQRLSDKYQAPFVLCCLEGMSKAEAARELGWKEGTVSGRLAQARKLLETRLARRGVVLSAALTAAAVAQQSAATAAPAVLVQATAQALVPQAGTAAATLSPKALALAHGALHTLTATKLAAVASVALAASVLIGGASMAALQDDPPPAPPRYPPAAPQARQPSQWTTPPMAVPAPDVPPGVVFRAMPVMALTFSPDGKRLITAGGVQGGVGAVPVVIEQAVPAGAAASAGGPIIVQAPGAISEAAPRLQRPAAVGQLRIWDADSGKLILSQDGIAGVRALAISPDGRLLATGGLNGMLQLMDAQSLIIHAMAQAHASGCNSVAFSADGKLLATAGLDQTVKLWDVDGLKLRKEFRGHTDRVLSVAFFRHGRSIVSGSRDQTARIWDLETGTTTRILKGHEKGIETVAVSPDDKLVATASWDQTLRLWDAETGQQQAVLEGLQGSLFSAAFAPDARLAAGAGNGRVGLWDVKTRNKVEFVGQPAAIVWALTFSPDGKRLASGSASGVTTIWDVASGKRINALAVQPPPLDAATLDRQKLVLQMDAQGQQQLRALEARDGVAWRVVPPAPARLGDPDAAKPGSKLWLLSVLAVGLVTTYLAFWFYVRYTRRKEASANPGQPAAAPVASASLPPLLFACTACGKRLRVRAALAGKKVKCPQCSEAVSVPADPVNLAIRPAT
jgi:RNA polymerase sigma factor (sigma-70 family)